jgi:hypothetical protein
MRSSRTPVLPAGDAAAEGALPALDVRLLARRAALPAALAVVAGVALLWLVGHRTSRRLGLRASAEISLGGAAATRLLPTGGVGGAALTIWAFRRAGLDGLPLRRGGCQALDSSRRGRA